MTSWKCRLVKEYYDRKTKFNTFEMEIARPGNITLKLKHKRELFGCVRVTLGIFSILATVFGFVLARFDSVAVWARGWMRGVAQILQGGMEGNFSVQHGK